MEGQGEEEDRPRKQEWILETCVPGKISDKPHRQGSSWVSVEFSRNPGTVKWILWQGGTKLWFILWYWTRFPGKLYKTHTLWPQIISRHSGTVSSSQAWLSRACNTWWVTGLLDDDNSFAVALPSLDSIALLLLLSSLISVSPITCFCFCTLPRWSSFPFGAPRCWLLSPLSPPPRWGLPHPTLSGIHSIQYTKQQRAGRVRRNPRAHLRPMLD